MSSPSMQAASAALDAGSMIARRPLSFAAMAIDSAPRTPITPPESDSSPTAAMPAIVSASSRPIDARIASAMGRS